MGEFSWHKQDTKEPIYSTRGHQSVVYMVDPRDGKAYKEEKYEGYGVFGGKDYYALLAEINKDNPEVLQKFGEDFFDGADWSNDDETRHLGIDLAFAGTDFEDGGLSVGVIYPILVEDYDKWKEFIGQAPESHENQGWYCDEEYEDDEW